MSPARRYCRYALVLALSAACTVSCRNRKEAAAPPPPAVPESLRGNRIGEVPGPVYQSQAASSIPWQPWSRETFKAAGEAERLVLAVVVMPQQQDFAWILRGLENEPVVAKAIRDTYVPVLVDGDVVREVGLLADPLCREIKRQLQMPVFIWMTPGGNPVAWIPISGSSQEEMEQLFLQSHGMVERMWKDDPDYVRRNSALDNTNRRQRLADILKNITPATDPAMESLNGARQLMSLYDPVSRTMDETGGLFPVGPIDVAVASGLLPGVPASLKARGKETSVEMLEDLLTSAMFDPLEGGVFSGRVDRSWALPMFGWNCPDQAKVATALFRAHRLTGDELALERAAGVLAFAERRFSGTDGLFRFGTVHTISPKDWMWSVGEIRKALPGQDAEWWIAATGMQERGNLPPEIDSARRYFRTNTLSLRQTLEKTAAELGADPAAFTASFRKSQETLRGLREARWKKVPVDDIPSASASFRMVSAYAAAYTATGEASYREKAAALLERAFQAFYKDGVLKAVAGQGIPSVTDARAFVHALAAQAAQDVADITLDPAALQGMEAIVTTVTGTFLKDGVLIEVSPSAAVLDLPMVDAYRVYDDSTGGLFAQLEARALGARGDFRESLGKLGRPLPSAATTAPVLYTDSIIAALVKHHSRSILVGAGLSSEMAGAVSRLPLQWFPRAIAKDSDGIPAGSVRVISPDGTGKLIANPTDLLKELYLSD
ncbi:DUF255 domain-containing protein [Luteolibacter sp. SL250]|uniref:DUF255 domain-containing protein n=1 Tax=Luteolibacter sp. SL250 TaxID=2995170 RepID=UPI0022716AE8|nr:DUF255 domain-containing protein [Luteolibacter sp. SL250]WAC18576.1 DUF255 domain-containing protein [Luteolibacter sp. SL250]